MTKWIFTWLRNDWKGINGAEVINKPELRELLRACEGFDVKWVCSTAFILIYICDQIRIWFEFS